jgi:hypothetical protein
MTLPVSNSSVVQPAIAETQMEAELPLQAIHQREFLIIKTQLKALLAEIQAELAQSR